MGHLREIGIQSCPVCGAGPPAVGRGGRSVVASEHTYLSVAGAERAAIRRRRQCANGHRWTTYELLSSDLPAGLSALRVGEALRYMRRAAAMLKPSPTPTPASSHRSSGGSGDGMGRWPDGPVEKGEV